VPKVNDEIPVRVETEIVRVAFAIVTVFVSEIGAKSLSPAFVATTTHVPALVLVSESVFEIEQPVAVPAEAV
jgi:hypothetical protein